MPSLASVATDSNGHLVELAAPSFAATCACVVRCARQSAGLWGMPDQVPCYRGRGIWFRKSAQKWF
jgi:hypothetical protein